MYPLLAVLGILLIVLTLRDVLHTMLVPGRIKRRLRFVPLYFHTTWRVWTALCCHVKNEDRREKLLSDFGPFAMVALLVLWTAALLVGFGLVQVGLTPGQWPNDLFESLYATGSRMFTITTGDWARTASISKVLAVVEAGAGLGFVTIIITYMPVLYQLFARREAHVVLLDQRAGTPVTAMGLICNHARRDALDRLTSLLAEWESWAAELLESHVSYPMLSYYRSQHTDQSWLPALTVVMDTCTLRVAGAGGYDLFQAEATLAMSVSALRNISDMLRVRSLPTYRDRLTRESFDKLLKTLQCHDLPVGGDDLWQRLSEIRKTYEPLAAAMAEYFVVDLVDWVPQPLPARGAQP